MTDWRIQYERLHTPRENGKTMIEPAAERIADLVDDNARLRSQFQYDLQGRALSTISNMARAELLAAARRWTAAYRNVPSMPEERVFLAGHQPEMFHPGVWFKNFVLGNLARRHGAAAVNLVVDNDAVSAASLQVPGGPIADPHSERVLFDRPDPKLSYEERRIEDRDLFASFGRRVKDKLAPLVTDPLIEQYWPMVQARANDTDRLGACLSQARHQLEAAWGLETLEVPLSQICSGEAFQWFAAHLLARLSEFRILYNEAIREYRRVHRVRSSSHPAPELVEQAGWQEAPLWVWTTDDLRRRRLFARSTGAEVVLSDRQSWEARLPLTSEGPADRAVERLLELQRAGVRIRSRALITTLWARLALGDLFIHGIGGAKYDRVTDLLFERFFKRPPPGIAVASATLLLPIEQRLTTASDLRAVQQDLRELEYHPERRLGVSGADAAPWVAQKKRWIGTPQTVENARQRCHAIREANAAMQPLLDAARSELVERLAETERSLQAARVLASREYAFCLHPEASLRDFLSVSSGIPSPG